MNKQTILILTTLLTAFVLVIIGGVMGRVSRDHEDITTDAETSGAASQATPTLTAEPDAQTLQVLLKEREAAYQEALEEANQKLDEAYKKQQELTNEINRQNQVEVPAAPAAPALPAAPTYPVTSDTASNIALTVVPDANLTNRPELIEF